MTDHEDHEPGDVPKPVNLDSWRNRPDRTKEPLRDGYRLDSDGILFDSDGRPRCSAKARNAPGGVCHSRRIKSQKRCRMHGGTSPKAKVRAAREQVETDMSRMVSMMDIQPVHDPLTALKDVAGEIIAWKDAMRVQVEKLNTLSYRTDYGETAKAVVQLFERSMDRATNVLAQIARLNIDERLAAVTESQAKQIEDAFFDALDALDMPVTELDKRENIAVAFARNLRVIPA